MYLQPPPLDYHEYKKLLSVSRVLKRDTLDLYDTPDMLYKHLDGMKQDMKRRFIQMGKFLDY